MTKAEKARFNSDITKVSPQFTDISDLVGWVEKRFDVTIANNHGPCWAGWQTFITSDKRIIYYETEWRGRYADLHMTYSDPKPFSEFVRWSGKSAETFDHFFTA